MRVAAPVVATEPPVVGDRDAGELRRAAFLIVRSCYATRHFVRRVPAENQEALFEALMAALVYLGGVFHTLWFDNLTPAIDKVLRGRARVVNARFNAFVSRRPKVHHLAAAKAHQ